METVKVYLQMRHRTRKRLLIEKEKEDDATLDNILSHFAHKRLILIAWTIFYAEQFLFPYGAANKFSKYSMIRKIAEQFG